MEEIKGLKRFNVVGNLPEGAEEQGKIFRSESIRKITNLVLGPEGTNMGQACEQWIKKLGIGDKTEIVFCETPEESIERARAVNEEGHIALFWTCAVYNCLCNVFFQNPDTLTFFVEEVMYLDEMQLATRPEKVNEVQNGLIPSHWKIFSHPSPAPLVRDLDCEVILTTSNAKAGELCAEGESDACITTESARKRYNLVTLHKFGSPKMVFFGGITTHGVEIIAKAYFDSKTIEGRMREIMQQDDKKILERIYSDPENIRIMEERRIKEFLGYRLGDMYCSHKTWNWIEEENKKLDDYYEELSQKTDLSFDLEKKVKMWKKLKGK